MAAGAEQRLDDYHFLRHTYETVSLMKDTFEYYLCAI
jgi:hypothetical protein